MVKRWKQFGIWVLAVASTACFAADKEHGTVIREATLQVAPGPVSEKLAEVGRGCDLAILEQSHTDAQPWIKALVTLSDGDKDRQLTGWLSAKDVVTTSTPNGDQIIFGQGADSEQRAEERGGRKGAAQDAIRLYARVVDFFPTSSLAVEAMWRSADIRWQLEKNDAAHIASRDLGPGERKLMDERFMQEIIKKFPGSKWADLAAYELIDNKVCGSWRALAECPLKEAAAYEQYARDHAQSPKATEALFNAAWRQAVLVDIYRIDGDNSKSDSARKKATDLAKELASQSSQGDWKPRAFGLVYKLEHKVPIYGPAE
jgi:hypothetical protein